MPSRTAPDLGDVLEALKGLREEVRREFARVDRELARVNGDQYQLSIREACQELGVGRSEDSPLVRAIRRGDLRTVQVGKHLKIRKTDLVRWLEVQAGPGGQAR